MMKKVLCMALAVLLLLGSLSFTAFAEDPSVTIKATVPSVSYEMVIPEAVPDTLDQTNHTGISVGAASVKDVHNASADTVISYTVTCGDFFKNDDNSIKMKALYTTDAAGQTTFPTDAVEVYKDNAAVDPLQMFVSIADDDWNDAPGGDYTAKVTYHYSNGAASDESGKTDDETGEIETVGEIVAVSIIPGAESLSNPPTGTWICEQDDRVQVFTYNDVLKGMRVALPLKTVVEKTKNGNYTCTLDGDGLDTFTIEFIMESNILKSIRETQNSSDTPSVYIYTAPQD